jgi:hypothetical protein
VRFDPDTFAANGAVFLIVPSLELSGPDLRISCLLREGNRFRDFHVPTNAFCSLATDRVFDGEKVLAFSAGRFMIRARTERIFLIDAYRVMPVASLRADEPQEPRVISRLALRADSFMTVRT